MHTIDPNDKDFQFIKEMARKFKKLSPKGQLEALTGISNLIKEVKDEDVKNVFQSMFNYFKNVHERQTENITEKFSDVITEHQKLTIEDLEGLKQLKNDL